MKHLLMVTAVLCASAVPASAQSSLADAANCSLPSANINCAMVNKLRALIQRQDGFTPQETMAWVDYGIRWHDQCVRNRSTFECDRGADAAVRRAIKANREAAE
jgi:hypothetical protein